MLFETGAAYCLRQCDMLAQPVGVRTEYGALGDAYGDKDYKKRGQNWDVTIFFCSASDAGLIFHDMEVSFQITVFQCCQYSSPFLKESLRESEDFLRTNADFYKSCVK